MSAVAAAPVAVARPRSVLAQLARKEIRRYATHPLFLVSLLLVGATSVRRPDAYMSSLGHVIVPAAGFGVIGLIVMASLVRGSDQAAESAGVVAAGERTRTLALASAVLVPFAASLLWLTWAVWAYHRWPAPASGEPFGPVGDSWAYAQLVALAVLPAVGGPILGLLIARWASFRGAAPVSAAVLVLLTIVMQGLFEPLRYVRVFAPWTYFGGPFGIEGDLDRMVILTGSPHWYVGYLLTLCALGLVVALLRDREAPRRRLLVGLVVVVGVALVLGVLAMTQGGAGGPGQPLAVRPVMIQHAARALPWSILAVAAALLPGFLVLVQHWPYALWPLQGTAVGLLAAGAVWCFDEPLAAIVDTTPRNLLWRTAARSVGVVLLVCAWSAAVAWTRSGLFGHALDVVWQGVAAVVAVGAFATWRRAAGTAAPARPIAAGLASVCVFLALARPFEDRLPIFPYTAQGDWAGGRMIWTVAALAGLLLLTRMGLSSDRRRRRSAEPGNPGCPPARWRRAGPRTSRRASPRP